MKLLFGFNISLEHHYYKSRRDEYSVRVWREVKYKRPIKLIYTPSVYPTQEPKEI